MTNEELTKVYDRFFRLGGPPTRNAPSRHFRRKETSMRLPGCRLLMELVQERHPVKVLDLGSGLTTIVLRGLQAENGMTVVTTDTDPHWLEVTRRELLRDELNTSNMFVHQAFVDADWQYGQFDLISVDCGNTDFRVTLAPKLNEWCAPHGVIVFDDMRLRKFGERMAAAIEPLGFTLRERKDTIDQFGNTLGTAERIA